MLAQMLNDAIRDSHIHDVARGVVGIGAPVSGFIVSRAENVEVWLRVASLGIGCLVGVATLTSLIITIRRKLRKEE